jgi:hypothetical protein
MLQLSKQEKTFLRRIGFEVFVTVNVKSVFFFAGYYAVTSRAITVCWLQKYHTNHKYVEQTECLLAHPEDPRSPTHSYYAC